MELELMDLEWVMSIFFYINRVILNINSIHHLKNIVNGDSSNDNT